MVTPGILLVTSLLSATQTGSTPWSEAAESFALGPVPPQLDLRNMLTQHIVRRSCELLDATVQRRTAALESGEWKAWRDTIRKAVGEALGGMPFGEKGGPLNVRIVSRHERPGYVVENVLFESLPGLDVNASVFLPLATDYPPPWPSIVVPCGHSAKTVATHQQPPQLFARCGYVAALFDPPAMGGEKQAGNDHFIDGIRCGLTGQSSNRYFLIDALRCIDYLATLPDVDIAKGVGMTGVSGGGMTTMFATLLDDRVKASGPSCCSVPNALHPVLDLYAPCPETLAFGRFSAYDDVDLLAAAMPTPVLLMAGSKDEVFTEAMSREIAGEVQRAFRAGAQGERFSFFLDECGHAYSPAMALEFVKWMDRWVRGKPDRSLPKITESDLELAPPEILSCHPRQDRNMFTVNRDVAAALRFKRSGVPPIAAARTLAGVSGSVPAPKVREGPPAQVWFHYIQELSILPEPGIELPGTFLYPARTGWRGAALLYFDDRGRWTDLRKQGFLTRVTDFIVKDTNDPAVLTVDLRGWGDTRPADTRYDLAGWGHRERWNAYLTTAMGDPIMAMRIRDGLAALDYLRKRAEIDPDRIIVGGRGLGGVVALHVAAIDGRVSAVFSADSPATFECLASAPVYSWSPEAFYPNVLLHYDLPELAAALSIPTLLANPRDAEQQPLTKEAAEKDYATPLLHPDRFRLYVGPDDDSVIQFIRKAPNR